MKYQNVCIEALGYTLPDEIVTSDELEARLEPLYRRLRLPQGRLELMTGIRQRRVWPAGTLPSEKSVESAGKTLAAAGLDKTHVGALIHASVCRDYLEPATACGVHHRLGLPPDCLIYDVSNACLGILDGIVQVANMIELGQIRAGIVVGTESSRPLVENTIRLAQRRHVAHPRTSQAGRRFAHHRLGQRRRAVGRSRAQPHRQPPAGRHGPRHTSGHELCHSGRDESVAGDMRPLMQTDSEQLMAEGIAAGVDTFAAFLNEAGWSRSDIDKSFCHQVGVTHRKLMLQSLELDPVIDFATVETLGNTGSVALPLTMALGIETGHLKPNEHTVLLGIGSGINSLMLAVDWQKSLAEPTPAVPKPHQALAGTKPPLATATR